MNKLAGLISANYNNERFGKLVSHRPIAAIPFGSRYRLIDFPLSNMVNSGIDQVGLFTPHFYRSLMDHLGSGKEFGLSRKNGGLFILPGSTYGYDLGTGKFSIKDFRGNPGFIVKTKFERAVLAACNKIFNIDYKIVDKFHQDSESNITLIYKKMPYASKGDIVFDIDSNGKLKGIRKLKDEEKNVNLFLDSLIIDKNVIVKIIEWYKDNSYLDIMDVISENLGRFAVSLFEFTGYTKSINDVKDYVDASMELLDEKIMKELFMSGRLVHTKVHDAPPVFYAPTANVSKSLVGTGSYIKGEVNNSVIFRDVIIEEGAVIKNSIIMQKCHIGTNSMIENAIIEKAINVNDGVVYKGTISNPIVVSNE